MTAWLAFGWGVLLGAIIGMVYAAGVVRRRRERVHSWTTCTIGEDGLTCSGVGERMPGDSFKVEANGTTHEVIVVNLTSAFDGHQWDAMDRAQYERRCRIEPDTAATP